MTVDMTPHEAELLIAVLTFTEGAARDINPALIEPLNELRKFRSALLEGYLRARLSATKESEWA